MLAPKQSFETSDTIFQKTKLLQKAFRYMKEKISGFSLKAQFILLSLCISLIPIAITSTIHYLNARDTVKKEALNKLAVIAELKKAYILSYLQKIQARTVDFSSDGFIRDSLEKINHGGINKDETFSLNRHLEVNKKSLDPSLGAIAVVDRSGRVVASTSEKWRGKDISQEEVFSQTIGLDPNKTYVRTLIFCPYIRKYCIDISTPITSKTRGDTIGLIINCFDMAGLSEITTALTGMGNTGEVYIVDKNKTMLTESRFVRGGAFTQLIDTEPVRRALEGGGGNYWRIPDYRGKSVVGVSVYLPEYEWVLVTKMDEAEVFSSLRKLGIVTLAVGLITTVLVTSVGMVFATSLSTSIRMLKDVTRRFAGGDLNIRVKIDRRDEIGDLGDSFNTMASQLAMEIENRNQMDTELKALNESLDQRIVERTQELAKTNELLQVEIRERKQNEQRKMIQYAIARILAESATLDEASPKILRSICKMMEWDLGGIWIIDHQANVIRCKEIWHVQSIMIPEFLAMSKKIAFSPGVGLPGRVWASAKHIWIADVVADTNFPRAHIAKKEGLHGAFGFPILSKEGCLGMIEFFSRELRQPNDDLINMIDAIGSHIGQFILRGQTEQLLERTVAERDASIGGMKHLVDFSVLMREEAQEEDVIRHMAQVLKDRFCPDILAVFMLDNEKNMFDIPIIYPPMSSDKLIKPEVILDPALCRVIRTGHKFIVRDIQKEPSCECLLEKIEEGGYMCMPLVTGETIAGVVMMVKKEKGYWERKELHESLTAYVGMAASALHRVRLLRVTRNAAITDALTGIYNRRFFDEMLEKQITLAKRRNESICLLVVDLDYFKKINDTCGHKAGDRMLQELTRTMKNSLRSSDILARYGGEEFAIIMPVTDMSGALDKAERLRKHVESTSFDNIVHGQSLKITISIGVVSFPMHGAGYNTLIEAADGAMYKAKRGGRNRVESP